MWLSDPQTRERGEGEGKNLDLIDLSGSGEDASMAADRS